MKKISNLSTIFMCSLLFVISFSKCYAVTPTTTSTSTVTPTTTSTSTVTPTNTTTKTVTATYTATFTRTRTATATYTATATRTVTATATYTATSTITVNPGTNTVTTTKTVTATYTATSTRTMTGTATYTVTATPIIRILWTDKNIQYGAVSVTSVAGTVFVNLDSIYTLSPNPYVILTQLDSSGPAGSFFTTVIPLDHQIQIFIKDRNGNPVDCSSINQLLYWSSFRDH